MHSFTFVQGVVGGLPVYLQWDGQPDQHKPRRASVCAKPCLTLGKQRRANSPPVVAGAGMVGIAVGVCSTVRGYGARLQRGNTGPRELRAQAWGSTSADRAQAKMRTTQALLSALLLSTRQTGVEGEAAHPESGVVGGAWSWMQRCTRGGQRRGALTKYGGIVEKFKA